MEAWKSLIKVLVEHMQLSEERVRQIVQEETEEVLQEILPVLGAAARGLGMAAKAGGKLAGKAAMAGGKAAARGIGKAAQSAGKMAMQMGKSGIKNMAKQVLKDPGAKQQVGQALKGIVGDKGAIGANLGAIKQNPIQSAMFIANLIPQFGMTVPQFVQIASQMSESNEKKVAQILKNSHRLLEAAKEEKWIQGAEKDIEKRGTEGVCTGDKFGSESCPPGSKRYNLAKTFRKMAKDRKKNK